MNTPKAVLNPPNPYQKQFCEWIDAPPVAELKIYEEQARSIISKNDSPDISFTYSINPYRGCFHACAYCYARPSHQYLDFGAGTDFERKIVVKTNAPLLLKKAFQKKTWKKETVVLSGNTDCYQPLELSYELTRACLQVCLDYENPVAIITKGAIIRRDLELLSALAKKGLVHVTMSIAFADDGQSKLIEPGAPRPSVRFRALKELSEAGIPTGVACAPVIPALNDSQIPEILSKAKACGASSAFMTLLRLPAEVKIIFQERLREHFPLRAHKVINQIKQMRGGELYRSAFGSRMRGDGEQWDVIRWIFLSSCEKYGLNQRRRDKD
jgi:DNA repair photolyase